MRLSGGPGANYSSTKHRAAVGWSRPRTMRQYVHAVYLSKSLFVSICRSIDLSAYGLTAIFLFLSA